MLFFKAGHLNPFRFFLHTKGFCTGEEMMNTAAERFPCLFAFCLNVYVLLIKWNVRNYVNFCEAQNSKVERELIQLDFCRQNA